MIGTCKQCKHWGGKENKNYEDLFLGMKPCNAIKEHRNMFRDLIRDEAAAHNGNSFEIDKPFEK